MYRKYFGFERLPFSLSPDPAFYFASEKHQEGLASLFYVIRERKGFALVTGEVGAGKTLLCRAALRELGPDVHSAYVTTTALSALELVQAICGEFDIPNRGRSKWEMLEDFGTFVAEQAAKGGNVVIIIDEAQNLPLEALEEVRMLSNFESDAEKFVQVLLVGQPELRKRAKRPEMQQLMQRFAVKFHLDPLDRQETARYIQHRLRLAGGNGLAEDLFTDETINRIFVYTRGIPRLINLLCDKALLTCYVDDCRTVTPAIIDDVIRELDAYLVGVEPATSADPRTVGPGPAVEQPSPHAVGAGHAGEPDRYASEETLPGEGGAEALKLADGEPLRGVITRPADPPTDGQTRGPLDQESLPKAAAGCQQAEPSVTPGVADTNGLEPTAEVLASGGAGRAAAPAAPGAGDVTDLKPHDGAALDAAPTTDTLSRDPGSSQPSAGKDHGLRGQEERVPAEGASFEAGTSARVRPGMIARPERGKESPAGEQTTIGRSAGNGLLAPPEPVSRERARLAVRTDGYVLLDLARTDGTGANGQRIKMHLALGRWPGARELVWVACDTWGGWPQERATFWAGEVTCRLCRRTKAFKAAASEEVAECWSARGRHAALTLGELG